MMNPEDKKIVQTLRAAVHQAKIRAGLDRKRLIADLERFAAEVELIQDDLRAEGIDPQSELGRACLERLLARRRSAAQQDPLTSRELWDWPVD